MDKPTSPPVLYLRRDGSLLMVRGGGATDVEMHLTVAQLLQLGVDCLRVAVELQPECLGEVTQALDSTMVQVPVDTPEPRPCLSLN